MSSKLKFSAKEVEGIFSKDRIQKLQNIYGLPFSDCVLLHERLNELSGTIFASLSIFEVHFRNIIDIQLSTMISDNWYETSIFAADTLLSQRINAAVFRAKENAYSKLDYQTRKTIKARYNGNRSKVRKLAIKSVATSKGDVISHLFFSFWRGLFSKKYEPRLWYFGLLKIFPNKSITRGEVSGHLETLHKVRNRIAHHEFVHPRLCEEYLKAIKFLTKEIRLLNVVRKGRVFRFQEAYIQRIDYQLSSFRHFLDICETK